MSTIATRNRLSVNEPNNPLKNRMTRETPVNAEKVISEVPLCEPISKIIDSNVRPKAVRQRSDAIHQPARPTHESSASVCAAITCSSSVGMA